MFTDTKRKKKNGKFIFTKHVIKGDMKITIMRVSATKTGNDVRNKRFKKRVSNRRKREKETSKTTFNRFKLNKGKIIF